MERDVIPRVRGTFCSLGGPIKILAVGNTFCSLSQNHVLQKRHKIKIILPVLQQDELVLYERRRTRDI